MPLSVTFRCVIWDILRMDSCILRRDLLQLMIASRGINDGDGNDGGMDGDTLFHLDGILDLLVSV